MNKRRPQRKKTSVKRKTKTTKKRSKQPFDSLKQRLNSVVVWVLVVINVILISSLVHRLLTPYTPPVSTSEIIPQDALEVQVLNGCGTVGIANAYAEFLRNEGYDVVNVGNAERWDHEYSKLIDRKKRDRKEILKLGDDLGLSKDFILPIESEDVQSDVSFIIGKDYQSLKSYQYIHR